MGTDRMFVHVSEETGVEPGTISIGEAAKRTWKKLKKFKTQS
jgi:hypothetical protein